MKIITTLALVAAALAFQGCSSSSSSPSCTQNSDCPMGQLCNQSGACATAPALCSNKPVWFQADNGGNHYKFGAAPFSAKTVAPYTQSYAALDAECVKQAGVLDQKAGKNQGLGQYNWKAVVIMAENGLTFDSTSVERDFYQHLIDYNSDYNCVNGTCTKHQVQSRNLIR